MTEGCGMTLSFGEQTPQTYERWAQAAGNRRALRYLLRIETSNQALFAHLHEGRCGAQKTWQAAFGPARGGLPGGHRRGDRHPRAEPRGSR